VQRLEPGNEAQQGALAAAGRAQQAGDAAGLQRQAGLVDGDLVAVAADRAGDGDGRGHVRAPGREAATRRVSQITAGIATTTIISDGQAAWCRRSSLAERSAMTARVSNPKGLRMMVAGSSLSTSMNTRSAAVRGAPLATGSCTRRAAPVSSAPRLRAAAIIDGVTRCRPASIGSRAAAIRRAT